MPIKNDTSTRFVDELRIISPWGFFIAFLAFSAMVALLVLVTPADKVPPSKAVLALLGVVLGAVAACYVLLIGYINRDAGRRRMSRVSWTLLAIFIPNALGIVLYFILRKPRMANCSQCGAVVEHGSSFCPQCRYRLAPSCRQCQRSVNASDKFCPFCGTDIVTAADA
jgi:RNA polymerase subunit RPABC4/transcription elongation factor Spt4